MNERSVYNYFGRGMTGRCLITRIETCTGNGVSDACVHLSGKHVWIEFKYIAGWPSRESTTVEFPLRPEQRFWLNSRGRLAGNCFCFIRIADDFFLMPWDVAIHVHDVGFKKAEWLKYPFYWHKKVDFDCVYKILKGGDHETE